MNGVDWVFEQGGWVSYALATISVLLWTAIALRTMALRPIRISTTTELPRGGSVLAKFVRDAQRLKARPARLDYLADRTKQQLNTMRGFITTLVAVAPLLGLLGTVTGMVEMFGSLQGALKIQGESTVAGGISTALVTTQLGLVIAAPGLIVAYWLTRQQLRREHEVLETLRSLRQEAP